MEEEMKKLCVTPFNEFWMDCGFNTNFSILCSVESSFRDLACLNCYTYIENKYKKIDIRTSDKQRDIISNIITRNPTQFKNNTDAIMIEKIINLLNDHLLLVGVNLYDWIPDSLGWQRYRWNHYSLVVDYDSDNKEFLVMDDDVRGFNLHRIPLDRFIIAIRGTDCLPHDGFIVTYEDYADKYNLEFSEVIENALLLIDSIGKMIEKDNLWDIYVDDIDGYFLEMTSKTFRFFNRQVANLVLVDRLYDLRLIDEKKKEDTKKVLSDAMNGWDLIKIKFLKAYKTKKIDVHTIKNLVNQQFEKEIKAWDILRYST